MMILIDRWMFDMRGSTANKLGLLFLFLRPAAKKVPMGWDGSQNAFLNISLAPIHFSFWYDLLKNSANWMILFLDAAVLWMGVGLKIGYHRFDGWSSIYVQSLMIMNLEPHRWFLEKAIGSSYSSFISPVQRAFYGPARHVTGEEGKESVASGEGFEHCNFAKDTFRGWVNTYHLPIWLCLKMGDTATSFCNDLDGEQDFHTWDRGVTCQGIPGGGWRGGWDSGCNPGGNFSFAELGQGKGWNLTFLEDDLGWAMVKTPQNKSTPCAWLSLTSSDPRCPWLQVFMNNEKSGSFALSAENCRGSICPSTGALTRAQLSEASVQRRWMAVIRRCSTSSSWEFRTCQHGFMAYLKRYTVYRDPRPTSCYFNALWLFIPLGLSMECMDSQGCCDSLQKYVCGSQISAL